MELTDSTRQPYHPEPIRSADDRNDVPPSPSSTGAPSPDSMFVVRTFQGDLTPPSGSPAELPEEPGGSACVACGMPEDRGHVLVCDGCERGFHLGCAGMRMPKAAVLDEWMCHECVSNSVPSNLWPLGTSTRGSGKNRFRLLNGTVASAPADSREGCGCHAADDAYCGFYALAVLGDYHRVLDGLSAVTWMRSLCQRGAGLVVFLLLLGQNAWFCRGAPILISVYNIHLFIDVAPSLRLVYVSASSLVVGSRSAPLRKQTPDDNSFGGNPFRIPVTYSNLLHVGSGFEEVDSGIEAMEVGPKETAGNGSQQFNDQLPIQYEDFYLLSPGKIDARPSYHDVNQIWPVGYRACWHDKITGSIFVCDVSEGGDSGPVFKVRRCSCSVFPVLNGATVLCRPNLGVDSDEMTSSLDCHEDFSVLSLLSEPTPPEEQDILSCLGSSSTQLFGAKMSYGSQLEPTENPENNLYHSFVLSNEIGEVSAEASSPSSAWKMVSAKLIDACHKIDMKTGTLKFFCNHLADGTLSSSRDIGYETKKDTFPSLAKFCGASGTIDMPDVIADSSKLESLSEVLMKWLDQDRFGFDADFVQEIVEQLPGVQACSRYVSLIDRSSYSSSLTVGNGRLKVITQDGVEYKDDEDGLLEGGWSNGRKRPRSQVIEDPVVNDGSIPHGKPISSRLPSQLVGDVLQVWEFLWRFYEVLDLKQPFSFEELEKELISPWFEGFSLLEEAGKKLQESRDVTYPDTDGPLGSVLPPKIESVSLENPHAFIQLETGVAKDPSLARWESVNYSRCTGLALTEAHVSLLKALISELQTKVTAIVDPNFETGESKSKRGRKKDADYWIAATSTKLKTLPLNELTWPELVRRYILAILSMDGILDSPEITIRESARVFRCLQGDGGVLCGSLTGVVGIEADALLLAEAAGRIFGSLNREDDFLYIADAGTDGTSSCEKVVVNEGDVPEWAKVLEPVRKLPTNVGARIRNCVKDALQKGPPEWAKKILEHSISKGVYKGNASGPTKKAVIAVLADITSLPKTSDVDRRRKKFVSISDILMKLCRIVLRQAAAADVKKKFCNLLGRKLTTGSDIHSEGILGSPAVVSCPLDFRTIDLRLAAGAYGGSHEAFLEDTRQLWINVRIAYGDQPDLVQLADTLAHNFEVLYEKEVVAVYQKLVEYSKLECLNADSKKYVDEILLSVGEIPKAPWEEGVCKVCGIDKDDDSVLLCDTCDAEYHTYCLNPPLARIPEGNWYCPSCVSGKRIVQDEDTWVIRQRRKKYRGEVIRNYLGSLAHLSAVIEEKEYWELGVDERTFLLKFLCDELLNSSLMRQHLEQCAEASTELLQKLRPLTAEWKTLKQKEECLAAQTEGIDEHMGHKHRSSGDISQLEGGRTSQQNSFDSKILDISDQSNIFQAVLGNSVAPLASAEDDKSDSLKELPCWKQGVNHMERDVLSRIPTLPPPEILEGHPTPLECRSSHSSNKLQLESLLKSVRTEILLLQNSIASIRKQLLKLAVRRELLGSDSIGRLYWILGESNTHPWLIVNEPVELQQRDNMTCLPGASDASGPLVRELLDANPFSKWTCYKYDREIKELVDCLKDDDPREKELKESILHWRRLKFQGFQQTETQEWQELPVDLSNSGSSESYSRLVTKATSLLHRKCRPCSQPEMADVLKKRARKPKVPVEQKTYRCECLELVWPSRHHCHRCHISFRTALEFDGHNNGKCNIVPPASNKSKSKGDTLEGKGMMNFDVVRAECTRDMDIVNAPSSRCDEFSSKLIKLQNEGVAPFDFEDICAKFKVKNSNKDLVKGIGLIGSNGNASLISLVSPCQSDLTEMLVTPPEVIGVEAYNPKADEQLPSYEINGTSLGGHTSDFSPTVKVTGAVKADECSGEQKDKISSMTEAGYCCIIPESSLRPLVGKASNILRQLKINLLDMDAALPEEALRLSKATLQRRLTWRAFVKSAESIYEAFSRNLDSCEIELDEKTPEALVKMVQATIVFEDMIKAEYLRNMWWYWSSLSAAAKISTLSSLALRIYSLDAAIDYEKIHPVEPKQLHESDPMHTLCRKLNKKRKEPEG
ncbi:hypothetical protein RJ640_024346 [Escallonia rubra]|uniref:Methyl-CpG-binding domain-containing protein 9 n=1 Tax=Escallonia rubra TaxID=112253 RepID=A0AA88UWH5_9ASTE|nr:hypothetical protein RJ640_024346 [Escallonia rubra]